jgi:hypothetical protein
MRQSGGNANLALVSQLVQERLGGLSHAWLGSKRTPNDPRWIAGR